MNIYFVGLSDVPFKKRAIDIRLLSFAKLFDSLGHKVIILNRLSGVSKCDMEIPERVTISYVQKSRNALSLLVAIAKEPFWLLKLHKCNKIDVLHLASGHFFDLAIYWLVCKLAGAKLIYHYCEFRSAFPNQNIYHKINGKLMNKVGPKLWDGSICISHFLEEKSKKYNKNVQTIIVPPICSFKQFEKVQAYNADKPYILFCGSVAFTETIELILDSYNNSKMKDVGDLYLILAGENDSINKIKIRCDSRVKFYKGLEYSKLISMIKGACGLLIPLRNTIQDKARFPNKICEYVGSGGLVLTTNIGEMPYYFTDKVDSVLATEFTVSSYSQAMDWVVDNQNRLADMKAKSYEKGIESFDLYSYKHKINNFLNNL